MMRRFSLLSLGSAAMLGLFAACPLAFAAETRSGVPAVADAAAIEEAARKYFPDENEAAPAKRIFRLTREQIDASVTTLLPGYVTQSVKEVMPRDPLQTNYEYADILSFNGANTTALAKWISDIAARVQKNPTGVIACESAKPADDCLAREARAFAVKAFRGDVSEEKLEQIVSFYQKGVKGAGFAQATGELVEVVLSSPSFLFRKELDVNKRGRLSPAQLLQALTYTIADVPPEKLQLDSSNPLQYLQTNGDLQATLSTILAAPETRQKLMRFFMAWLEVKDPAEFTISSEVFKEFSPKLAAAMVTETRRFLEAELSKPAPKLRDITQSTRTFLSKELEPIYGAKAADPAGAKPSNVDPAQRYGIFSQPAVLASHSGPTSSQPVKRGVFWVRKVMCMDLDPPPPGLDVSLYLSEATTERKRIEAATSMQKCLGCHKMIDPFGFALESYDALGRWRTTENGHPVDTSIAIDFLDEAETKTRTPVEALKALTSSVMFKQCFVRQMFRYYLGRNEEPADDPLLRRMFVDFATNDQQDILQALQTMALSDRSVRRQ